jgi:mono/diheme cytochrome c family protein
MMGIRTRLIGVALLMLTLPVGTAFAADLPGDPLEGRELVENWCAECHDVAPAGIAVEAGVPAFQTLADDPAFTEMALRAFLRTPHDQMPDVMPTQEQTDHIIAYILSLKSQ